MALYRDGDHKFIYNTHNSSLDHRLYMETSKGYSDQLRFQQKIMQQQQQQLQQRKNDLIEFLRR